MDCITRKETIALDIKISPSTTRLTNYFEAKYYQHQRNTLAIGVSGFVSLIILSVSIPSYSALFVSAAIAVLFTSFINMSIFIFKFERYQMQFFFILGIVQRYTVKRFCLAHGINNHIKAVK